MITGTTSSERILSRKIARELTPDESRDISGGTTATKPTTGHLDDGGGQTASGGSWDDYYA